MKIKQVEELVGITSKNIRFYEEQGLLTPERAENGYREYHEENIKTLKKIKLLRKLGVPVEEIKSVLSKSISLEECLENQMRHLEKERENLKCNAPDLIKINSKDIYVSSYNMQIGVFIIPKGSKYFVNEHLDYISSSIIFKYKFNVGRILNDLESKKEYLMFDLEKQFYHKYAT